MIHTARAMGLKIMLGYMIESQILATAAAHLSPLVDWADLDGPFLTTHGPFSGITCSATSVKPRNLRHVDHAFARLRAIEVYGTS